MNLIKKYIYNYKKSKWDTLNDKNKHKWETKSYMKDNDYKTLYKYMANNNFTLFTVIKDDPIDRFLSGFFELCKQNKYNFDHTKSSIQNMRQLLHRVHTNYNRYNLNIYQKYYDTHLLPQISFLFDYHWNYFPFDYIGFLNNSHKNPSLFSNHSAIQILNEYSPKSLKNFIKILKNRNSSYSQKYNRSRYIVNKTSLSPHDYQILCELYWMDYLCFPIKIPKMCSIKTLFKKHYYKDMIYNECF